MVTGKWSARASRWLLMGLLPGMLVGLFACSARAEETVSLVAAASGSEIVSERYPASGECLVLWFTGQYGHVEEEHKAAAYLAAQGVETWVTDFYAPYFLPQLPSSAARVPDADLADWLESVRRTNPGRRIVLAAPGHLAGVALRAVVAWRQRAGMAARAPGQRDPFAGALLLFPLLYQELQPGQEPAYDPVVDQAHLDMVILQPKLSAGYWWRDRLKARLEAAGSRVWLSVLNGLRDGFYRRGDASTQESDAGAQLGKIVLDGLKSLMPGIETRKTDQP